DWSSDVCSSDLITFNVVFTCIAHAAKGLHSHLARIECGLCTEVLGTVGKRPAGLTRVVQGGSLLHHEVGRLELHPGLCQRMLDALVLTDGAAEHRTVTGIFRGLGAG